MNKSLLGHTQSGQGFHDSGAGDDFLTLGKWALSSPASSVNPTMSLPSTAFNFSSQMISFLFWGFCAQKGQN
jgi:hypothetical protein